MPNHTVIIGAGITGLITAQLLHLLDPDMKLSLFDAGPEPRFRNGSGRLNGHYGATLGHSRDARQFTGTEGLSFQNPIHARLLFELAGSDTQGMLTIAEDQLTARERKWREECLLRFTRDVKPEDNPYDRMYTALNYGGMAAWGWLVDVMPELARNRLSDKGIYIALSTLEEVRRTLEFEKNLNPFQNTYPVKHYTPGHLYKGPKQSSPEGVVSGLVKVPGSSWAIQSLWTDMYKSLSQQKNIEFNWDSPITKRRDLPPGDAYVWAAGIGYDTPDLYRDHGRVQGVGGWWLTVPNPGYTAPFKFVAPQPCGVINLTPNGKSLYVSGGFGWVGERPYEEAKKFLEPIKEHFMRAASSLLHLNPASINLDEVDYCIRPSTPTGLPDIAMHTYDKRSHITISGAGKAGATQAPLLAMHVAKELGLASALEAKLVGTNRVRKDLLTHGLAYLEQKLEP